jgi:hypothetical protein
MGHRIDFEDTSDKDRVEKDQSFMRLIDGQMRRLRNSYFSVDCAIGGPIEKIILPPTHITTNIDVCITKICLDISILTKSITSRRK